MLISIPAHKTGDTWGGIPNINFVRKGIPLNLTGASIKMQVRLSNDSPTVLELSNSNGGIIITNPLNGQITIPPKLINIPVGNYKYEIKIHLSNGETKTFIEGTWSITEEITK
jgi:hypothetical protein